MGERVDLIHLECFVTLAEELHFGRAAARLHVGTPAMSKRVAELEKELDLRLFSRTSRAVRLTPAGEALLPQARRALLEVKSFRSLAVDAAAGSVGGIRAAYSPGTGELLTALVEEIRKKSPALIIHPVQMVSLHVAAAVRAGSVLVGIARIPPDPDLRTMVLSENQIAVVVLPRDHRLAGRDVIHVSELGDEVLLAPPRAYDVRDPRLVAARHRDADVSSEGELFDLVAAGFGILLSTEGHARRNPRHDVIVRPLTGSSMKISEYLMWRPDEDSPVLQTILEVARCHLPELARVGM